MPTTMKKGHPFSCCSSLKGTLPQKREKRAPPGNEEHLAFRGHGTKTKHGAGGGGWGGETTAKGTYSMFLPKNVETAASFRKASASNTRNTTKFHLRDSQKWEGHPKSLRFVGKKIQETSIRCPGERKPGEDRSLWATQFLQLRASDSFFRESRPPLGLKMVPVPG